MRISEITTANKPYIRIVKGKKKVDIPVVPKLVLLPSNSGLRKYAFVGCENMKVQFKGKTVKLNWRFNHNKMTLYCTGGRKAYSWTNIKVVTVNTANGKKEHLIVCKRDYGDETERRRYKRYPLIKKITITQGDNSYDASTVDISYNGVGIILKRNLNITPKEPLTIDFGEVKPVRARIVRTIFKEDGSEILGCYVSPSYKYEMVKLVSVEDPIAISISNAEKKKKEAETDKGWTDKEIKRWH